MWSWVWFFTFFKKWCLNLSPDVNWFGGLLLTSFWIFSSRATHGSLAMNGLALNDQTKRSLVFRVVAWSSYLVLFGVGTDLIGVVVVVVQGGHGEERGAVDGGAFVGVQSLHLPQFPCEKSVLNFASFLFGFLLL